tara:strand:+ start:111 stop:392 length:282 start_codon:yes stop_codon:yes gene_type:complete
MKRLQMPENKIARLAINIAFISCWFYGFFFYYYHDPVGDFLNKFESLSFLFARYGLWWCFNALILLLPIILVTRYIWWGRLKPRPRITRSKDD